MLTAAVISGRVSMNEPGLDKIHVRDLKARCIIGVYPEERTEKQEIVINMTLHVDLATPCRTDQFEDTVDYKAIKKAVLELVEDSECFLIERLAQMVADTVLAFPLIQRVDVCVDKPGALRFARSVAVEISRDRHGNE